MTHLTRPPAAGSRFAVRLIDASHHRTMRWKNGFGTTTEIAIDPPDADLGGRFRWRLSVADVQRSGSFSPFPGYDRTIMVIEGGGMILTIGNDAPRRLDRPFEPLVFSGDAPTDCRLLEGPIRDFNLMVDRSLLQSRMQVCRGEATAQPVDLASADHIVHCFEGAVDLAMVSTEWSCRLGRNETAVFQQEGSGEGAVLQVAPVAGNHPTIVVITLKAHSNG